MGFREEKAEIVSPGPHIVPLRVYPSLRAGQHFLMRSEGKYDETAAASRLTTAPGFGASRRSHQIDRLDPLGGGGDFQLGRQRHD
jgi:hypothetical protein